MTWEFENIFELRDYVATFLNEEDARYMVHDIAICIVSRNEEKHEDYTYPYDVAGHDIAEIAEMVREQETDENGNWLYIVD